MCHQLKLTAAKRAAYPKANNSDDFSFRTSEGKPNKGESDLWQDPVFAWGGYTESARLACTGITNVNKLKIWEGSLFLFKIDYVFISRCHVVPEKDGSFLNETVEWIGRLLKVLVVQIFHLHDYEYWPNRNDDIMTCVIFWIQELFLWALYCFRIILFASVISL